MEHILQNIQKRKILESNVFNYCYEIGKKYIIIIIVVFTVIICCSFSGCYIYFNKNC